MGVGPGQVHFCGKQQKRGRKCLELGQWDKAEGTGQNTALYSPSESSSHQRESRQDVQNYVLSALLDLWLTTCGSESPTRLHCSLPI